MVTQSRASNKASEIVVPLLTALDAIRDAMDVADIVGDGASKVGLHAILISLLAQIDELSAVGGRHRKSL